MATGRNERCPCGSGRKFKKCCLGKEQPSRRLGGGQPAEPRFISPASGYYTQAALVEAMRPNGSIRIHPYALIKLREDALFGEEASPERRVVLQGIWRPSKVAVMTNEQIAGQLRLLGAPYDRDRFLGQARRTDSAWEIGATWHRPLGDENPMHEDFLGLAACELWRRLCPERPSLEMLDDWLCEGYAYCSQGNTRAAMASWWQLWEALRPRLGNDMKTMSDAGDHLFPMMSQCLSNWSGDFRMEALNASYKIPECGETGVRFIRDQLEAFPESPEALNLRGDLAMIYYSLKRNAEAEECCEQMIRDCPDRADGYVHLSDGLRHDLSQGDDQLSRLERAAKPLEDALAFPVVDAADFDVDARLEDIRTQISRINR